MAVKRKSLSVTFAFCGVVLSIIASVHPLDIRAQSSNRVGLVVGKGDGSFVTRCVEFAEDELSGYDLLMRSGLQVVAIQSGGMGVMICEIDGEGCPANNCWCKCSGSTCTYWSYWHLEGREWSYAFMGALGHRVRSGDVDGWTWGAGDPPPALSFEQICAPLATASLSPTATPTILLTDTPTLAPTATAPLPTHTPQPAGTATALPTTMWTSTASLPASTSTPSLTPSPQSVAAQRATRALPTRMPAQATLTVSPKAGEAQSNYILFGALVAVLFGVMVVIVLQRQR